MKLGLMNPYPASIMPEHFLRKTFLEELRAEGYRVIAIEVPGYNESRDEYYRSRIEELKLLFKRARLVEEALGDTKKRIAEAASYGDKGYEVVFVYSPLPDIIFHMALKPSLRVKIWLRTIHYPHYSVVIDRLESNMGLFHSRSHKSAIYKHPRRSLYDSICKTETRLVLATYIILKKKEQ